MTSSHHQRELRDLALFLLFFAALAAEALGFMNANKITCLFVTQDGGAGNMPVGILHVHDILRAGIA